MVTVLRAPPRPAGATDTWTLGPEGQASPFLLSGPARPGCLPGGPAGTDASRRLVPEPGLEGTRPGPPWGASGASRLAGACSSRRASRVSWVRCVAQTSQRRSASGRQAGRTPGAGSLSRSNAERQGSWGGSKEQSGQCPGTLPLGPHLHSTGCCATLGTAGAAVSPQLMNEPPTDSSARAQQENNYRSFTGRPAAPRQLPASPALITTLAPG